MMEINKTVNVRVCASLRCSPEALEVGRDGLDHSRRAISASPFPAWVPTGSNPTSQIPKVTFIGIL